MSAAAPRTLQNAAATLVARGLGIGVRLLVLGVLVRFLPPEQLGVYSLLVSTLDVARVMANFGLDTATIRRMAIDSSRIDSLLQLVLRLKTVFAGIGLAVFVLLAFSAPAGVAPWAVAALGVALFPLTWGSSLMARFQVAHEMSRLVLVQAAAGFLSLSAVVLAAFAGARLNGFLLLVPVAEALTCAGIMIAARRRWPTRATESSPVAPVGFLRESLPLGLYDMVVIAYARLGVFLLDAQGPAAHASIGYLYAALKVNEFTVAIAGALAISALPVFSRLAHEGNRPAVLRTFARYSLAGAAFSGTMAAFFTLFGSTIIHSVRPAYDPSARLLVVFAWAGVAMFQNNLSVAVLNSFGRFRAASACAVLNLCVYGGVSVFLIPRYGAMGAAISTLVTESINMVVQLTLVLPMLVGAPKTSPGLAAET